MTVEHSHNFKLLLEEIGSRGIEICFVTNTDVVRAKCGEHVEYLWNGLTRLTPVSDRILMNDKYYAKCILHENGFPVAEGIVFSSEQCEDALAYCEYLGYPVVLKPTDASSGDLVFAHIVNPSEFKKSFLEFAKKTSSRNMLVEKHFFGDDHQFMLVKNKGVAVAKRSLPSIQGDGVSTIRQLIDRENDRRMNPRNTCLCEIYVDDPDGSRALEQQGLTVNSILGIGEKVHLRNNANVSWGGFCEEVTESVHPSYIENLRKIFNIFTGSSFLVVDLLAKDITQPASHDNHIISEFNAKPAFSMYQQAAAGKANYIVKDVVDLLFPETENTRA
jgi:cyanophycin synthetase